MSRKRYLCLLIAFMLTLGMFVTPSMLPAAQAASDPEVTAEVGPDAEVGSDADIGPDADIDPDADIGPDAVVEPFIGLGDEIGTVCEVRAIETPVAGHFPSSLYKYPYKANKYNNAITDPTVANGFNQTLTWEPEIERAFLPDTVYAVTLTLEPNAGWSSCGMPGGTDVAARSFSAQGITPSQIGGLPTKGVKEMTWEYTGTYTSGGTTNQNANLLIHITFEKTGSTEVAPEYVLYEDFTLGINAQDKTVGKGDFMMAQQVNRQGLSNWRDDNTYVNVREDGGSELVLGFKKDPGGTSSLNKYVKNNWITASGVRTRGRSTGQGGGLYGANDIIFEHSYGYYEASIKFPQANVVWGAFWLFSPATAAPLDIADGGSKYATEIDIAESPGFLTKFFNAAYHTYRSSNDRRNGKASSEEVPIFSGYEETGVNIYDGNFHKIGLEWSPTDYKFYVDDILFGSWENLDSHYYDRDVPYEDWSVIRQNEGVMQNPAYIKLTVEAAEWADETWDDAWAENPDNPWGDGRLGVTSEEGAMVVDYVYVLNGPKPALSMWTVTFDNNSSVTTQSAIDGSKLTEPSAPTRSGYRFEGWYKDAGYKTAWDFDTDTVTGDITLYAKWTRTGGGDNGNTGGSGTVQNTEATVNGNVITARPVVDSAGRAATSTVGADAVNSALRSSDTAVIKIPASQGVNKYTLNLPAPVLSSGGTGKTIEIETSVGTMRAPQNMFGADEIGNARNIGISIASAGQIDGRPAVELSAAVDGRTVSWNNPDAPVTISILYTPTKEEKANPEHITVYYIDGAGNIIPVTSGRYDPKTGMVTFTATHFSKYAVAFVEKTFDDIDGYSWARNAIEVMASKGVLEGASGSGYSPASSITRADFMLFLARALNLSARVDGNFSDVSPSDYYYEAVGIAKKLGVTAGVGNNRFNPDASVTRQEMMTLTDRALSVAKRGLPAGVEADLSGFGDRDKIADYAVRSVAKLVKSGIMTGEGASVNPLGNTTRAEAAVIIYRVYNTGLN